MVMHLLFQITQRMSQVATRKTPAQTTIRKNSGKSIISLKKSRQLP
jgi:hypothetical protein